MTPENRLRYEEQGCADCRILSHPPGSQMIKCPHAKQEHNEIDKVLDIHGLQVWQDLFPRFFKEGCEHHERRTVIFKTITGDRNSSMLRPSDIRSKGVRGIIV